MVPSCPNLESRKSIFTFYPHHVCFYLFIQSKQKTEMKF